MAPVTRSGSTLDSFFCRLFVRSLFKVEHDLDSRSWCCFSRAVTHGRHFTLAPDKLSSVPCSPLGFGLLQWPLRTPPRQSPFCPQLGTEREPRKYSRTPLHPGVHSKDPPPTIKQLCLSVGHILLLFASLRRSHWTVRRQLNNRRGRKVCVGRNSSTPLVRGGRRA